MPQLRDLVVGEIPPLSGLETDEAEPGIPPPMEVPHGVAYRLAHALHLVLAPFVQGQLDSGDACSAPDDPSLRGRRSAVLENDPSPQCLESVGRRRAVDVDVVHLGDAEARVRQPVRELAVVREKQRAGGIHIEPAHRDDARLAGDEIDDRRPALRVVRGRKDACGLVQKDVAERLPLDTSPVDLDDVVFAHEGVQLARLVIHAHPSFEDQLVRTPTRGDARAGEERVQPHAYI